MKCFEGRNAEGKELSVLRGSAGTRKLRDTSSLAIHLREVPVRE